MRSTASGASALTTTRSHALESLTSSPPCAATTAPSLARNTRSRAARKTRLAREGLHGRGALLGARAPPDIEEGRTTGDHENRVARRWRQQSLEHEKHRWPRITRRSYPVTPSVPLDFEPVPRPSSPVPLEEYIVVDLIHARCHLLARSVEGWIEPLPIPPREVLLRGPIVGLERRDVGAPLEVMAELVRQRIPCLAPPVEVALIEASERGERAVVQDDPGLQ